jgi:hypothetical protein
LRPRKAESVRMINVSRQKTLEYYLSCTVFITFTIHARKNTIDKWVANSGLIYGFKLW